MRKLIATINMTLDGFCDHTAVDANEELHRHYTELLNRSGAIIYGRKTYQLMENYWPTLLKEPGGNKAMDEFALAIDAIPKIVFSHTLKSTEWKTARFAKHDIAKEVTELKQQVGKDILVGSPGLIITLMNLHLIDELQLCVHPVVVGSGLPLFKDIHDRVVLKLLNTKRFSSGAITLYYETAKND